LTQFADAGKEVLFESKTGKWVIAGATVRYIGTYSVGFYKPLYFAKVFPGFVDEFSIGNALIYVAIATSSALIGGQLSDRLESKSLRTKSYLCMTSALLACPAMVLCTTHQDDFWFTM
jgi:hypothetical protein